MNIDIEKLRTEFETHAEPKGFDLTRANDSSRLARPWAEYINIRTERYWAGFRAHADLQEKKRIMKYKLTQSDIEAFQKAIENKEHATALTDGSVAFINYGEEPDLSELNCPECGGSGHIDDRNLLLREDILIPKRPPSEAAPDGIAANQPGSKLDSGKSPVRRGLLEYFPRACLAVAEVSAAGAAKYTWNGWESVKDGIDRYGDAEVRHICKAKIEGLVDPDFGLTHAAHEAWNALARLELLLRDAP